MAEMDEGLQRLCSIEKQEHVLRLLNVCEDLWEDLHDFSFVFICL